MSPGIGAALQQAVTDLGERLVARGLTIATAESITGGGVGAALVTAPGASRWYRGGVITYATDAKALLAGVDRTLLDGPGPVSAVVAAALARGAADGLRADLGLAVVGVAGPDAVGDTPVGTVRAAVAGRPARLWEREGQGLGHDRVEVQAAAVELAVHLLADAVRSLP